MQTYEAIIILVHQATEDRQKELVKKVDSVFLKFGSVITAHHDRGRRTLGYPMKKHKEGHVYVYDVEITPAKVKDVVRELRLEDQLLQAMISFPVPKSASKEALETIASGR